MRGGLNGLYQGATCSVASEPTELFRRDDHDFVTAVHRHMLRSVTSYSAHQLAEPGFGILQQPVAGT